jgi:aerobic-type carbon monoxide dehydrogenase small subunit (CoxS/CutS family)
VSSEQPQGQPPGGQGWEPLPQGDYDADATTFVRLPDDLLDPSAMLPGAEPLAAPGRSYVPPPIAPASEVSPPTVRASTDPAATGQWTMPFTDGGAGGGWGKAGPADSAGGAGGGDATGATGETGQWAIPHVDETLDESGEYLVAERRGPTGPHDGDSPATGSGPWYDPQIAQGTQVPDGRTGPWAFPTAGEQSPGPATTEGGQSAGDDWSTAAAATGHWSVPTGDQPDAEPSAAHGTRPGQEAGPPGVEGSTAWPASAGGPWQTTPAEGQLPGHARVDESGGGSLPGRGARNVISRLTRAASAAAERAERADAASGSTADPGPGSPKAPPSTSAADPAEVDAGPATDAPPAEDAHDGAGDAPPDAVTAETAPSAETAATAEPADPPEPGAAVPAVQPHTEHPLASYVLTVNGADRPVTDAWIGESLLYVLRERLGLAGAKDGCSQGECGACSVQVDSRLVASCLVPAATAAGCDIRTVEGLAADGIPSDVQRALAASGAVQCGFCAPGLAMTVHDLLRGNPAPTELEIRQALSGNLCRCTGYRGVLEAVREVVEARADSAEAEMEPGPGPGAGAPFAEPGTGPAEAARIPHQADPYGGDLPTGGSA